MSSTRRLPLRADVDLVDGAGKPQLLYEKRTSDLSAQQVLQARQLYLVALVTRAHTRTRTRTLLRLHSALNLCTSPVARLDYKPSAVQWGQCCCCVLCCRARSERRT